MLATLQLFAFINVIGVIICQFVLVHPLIAEIKCRFQELDHKVKWNSYHYDRDYVYFKARRLNQGIQDPTIDRLLDELKGYIKYSIFSFVILAVIVILNGVLNY